MNAVCSVLMVLLSLTSCRDPGTRPDASIATGGSRGTDASGDVGGTTPRGGSGGTAVDALVDWGSDSGNEDGSDGAPDSADSDAALEPIRVFGGNPDASLPYHDLEFVGSGLEQYEGAVVTFRIGAPTGIYRLGVGQVRIVEGAFDVLFPQVLSPTYEQKIAHIDTDGSGSCEIGELTFADFALYLADTTLTVTPGDVRLRSAVVVWCDLINN